MKDCIPSGTNPESTSRRELLRHSLYGAGLLAASSMPFAPTAYAAASKHSVAETKWGKIRGAVENGVHVFKGVPYGADTATRRYRSAFRQPRFYSCLSHANRDAS